MKRILLLYSVLVTPMALLTGCVGYNTTLFTTKSNVGLDFDSKPPTVEITVSRKEAVIAPVFEGGQTPPVMASFKPDSHLSGIFHNFFVGVDQTFAGGDAAVTMSKLYNEPDASESPSISDSTLKLTTVPKYKDVFRRLATPGKVRPFVFGTDTMLGLKVAWSGTAGQMPDSVKLGFNRKELAWAPLTMTTNLQDQPTPYHVRSPSFLATIDSQIGTDTNKTGISALQYFSTGRAATLLALRQDVRAAMLARLDPNGEKFRQRFGTNLAPEGRSVALSLINLIYLQQLLPVQNTDPKAAAIVQRLDSLMPAELEYDFTWYGYDPATKTLQDQKQSLGALKGNANLRPFQKLNSYVTKLNQSIGALRAVLIDDGPAVIDGVAINTPVQKGAARERLDKEKTALEAKQRKILDYLDQHGSTLREAVEFFYN